MLYNSNELLENYSFVNNLPIVSINFKLYFVFVLSEMKHKVLMKLYYYYTMEWVTSNQQPKPTFTVYMVLYTHNIYSRIAQMFKWLQT